MPVMEIHFHLRGIGAAMKLLPGSWLCHWVLESWRCGCSLAEGLGPTTEAESSHLMVDFWHHGPCSFVTALTMMTMTPLKISGLNL